MTTVVHEQGTNDAELVIDVPPDFAEVPLDEAIEDRSHAQRALVDRLGIDDARQREGLVLYLEAIARRVRSGPVIGAAFCAVRLGGRPSTATLTVATMAVREDATGPLAADPLVVAAAVAETLRTQRRTATVSVERIGQRPMALAREVVATVPVSHLVTIAGAVPGRSDVAVITVSTPSSADAATYERLARQMAASMRWSGSRSS